MSGASILLKKQRTFLPHDFRITDWESLKPYYENLLNREIYSDEDLSKWFKDRSELESAVDEDAAWRYIRMTCDTLNEDKLKAYTFFVNEIEPQIAPYADKLNRKAVESPFIEAFREKPEYDIAVKLMKKDIHIFREKNVPLKAQIQTESQKYNAIAGAMTVEHDGKELTLQQAAALLEEQDRELRSGIYMKISACRLHDRRQLDDLFDKLVELRHRVALNADYSNYRDYMFAALGRMDYTPQDCFAFHDSVQQETVPLLNVLAAERKEKLGLTQLKPWDKSVDITGQPPLKPYQTGDELVEKTIACFGRLDPFFADCLKDMKERGFLDLDSRKGKAPGGYNYPLSETGAPFIFMNSSATLQDLVTMVHEGGHAIHSYLMDRLPLNMFRQTPSEVAELASMSMELLSMEHWDLFFENEEELKRAKREQLEGIITTLPWVAAIDRFQHWIYENPEHAAEQRSAAWVSIFEGFSDAITDWTGLEEAKSNLWQKQLHLYEVPFYYIEYGMAQLGALAIWKNYKENPAKALEGYVEALKLGYTRTIPEIYKAANIQFDFSREHIRGLMEFLGEELVR